MNTTTAPTAFRTPASSVTASVESMMLNVQAQQEVETRVGHLAATGFGLGGTIGAVVGALAVGIASMTTEVILPGSALYVAGPLSALLLGAGAGAANGGLAGALIGWGIPVELSVEAQASLSTRHSVRENVRAVLCSHCK